METANDEDIITEGKYIIIRRTFDKNSYKLVKIGSEKYVKSLNSIFFPG